MNCYKKITDETVFNRFKIDSRKKSIFIDLFTGIYFCYNKSTRNMKFSYNGLNKIVATIDLKAIFGNDCLFMVEYPIDSRKYDLAISYPNGKIVLNDFEDSGIFHRYEGRVKVSSSDKVHIRLARETAKKTALEYNVISIPDTDKNKQREHLIHRLELLTDGCKSFCLVSSRLCKDKKIHVRIFGKKYIANVNEYKSVKVSYTVNKVRHFETIHVSFKKDYANSSLLKIAA